MRYFEMRQRMFIDSTAITLALLNTRVMEWKKFSRYNVERCKMRSPKMIHKLSTEILYCMIIASASGKQFTHKKDLNTCYIILCM